jgi:hypothetical protein
LWYHFTAEAVMAGQPVKGLPSNIRVIRFVMPDGEPVEERWHQTGEFCVSCGQKGTWTHATDRAYRVCPVCRTVLRTDPDLQPEVREPGDPFAEIAAQLAA